MFALKFQSYMISIPCSIAVRIILLTPSLINSPGVESYNQNHQTLSNPPLKASLSFHMIPPCHSTNVHFLPFVTLQRAELHAFRNVGKNLHKNGLSAPL